VVTGSRKLEIKAVQKMVEKISGQNKNNQGVLKSEQGANYVFFPYPARFYYLFLAYTTKRVGVYHE
jgi:hypothetical protein